MMHCVTGIHCRCAHGQDVNDDDSVEWRSA